jgi:hypothetical protein
MQPKKIKKPFSSKNSMITMLKHIQMKKMPSHPKKKFITELEFVFFIVFASSFEYIVNIEKGKSLSRLAYVKTNVYNSTIWSCSTSPGDKSNGKPAWDQATRFLHKGELRKHSGRRNHQRRPRKLFCLLAELMIPRIADLLRKPSVKLSH